jgi:hypothetical protein
MNFCPEWYYLICTLHRVNKQKLSVVDNLSKKKNWLDSKLKSCLSFSNNMLYPMEDKQRKKLELICRLCNHRQEAKDPCIYTNNIKELEEYVTTIHLCVQHLKETCF